MARQGWGRHTTVVTGTNDDSKQVSKNEWNADLNETGMLGFDLETKTLSSDALTPLSTANIVAGEGGSADDFSYITYGAGPEVAEEDILFFYKGSQVITVTHNTGSAPSNSGNIQLLGGASKVLNTNLPLILQRKGNVFYEIISSAGTTVTAGSTTTFTNKSIDLTDNTLTGSSAELATAISDETGSGALVFGTSPTFVTPALGQPASGNLADCTFPTLNQSTTGSSASCTGLSATATALATGRAIGGTSFDGTAAIDIVEITVADTTDTTCSVALFESATGTIGPKSDAGLTYNAGTGTLTATAFAGPLTGNVTGDASGSSGSCTGNSSTASNATLAAGLSAQLVVASGGTNLTSYTVGDIVYASGTTTLAKLNVGSNTNVLTLAGGVPTWAAPASGADTPWGVVHDFDAYYYDMEIQSKPSDPAADNARFYVKEVDSDNDGLFCLIRKNGAFEETQIV